MSSLAGKKTNNENFGIFARISERMLPFDHVAIIYCWLIIILTMNLGRPISQFIDVLVFHSAVILAAFLLSYYCKGTTNRFWLFFRLLYPVLLILLFYKYSGQLVNLIIPGFLDYQIITLEKSILGINPTLWLDTRLNIIATELLSASYFSYYFMIPGLTFILFFSRRDAELKRFITGTCVTFFISYIIFILYPVESPRFYFSGQYQNAITGPFFRSLVDFAIGQGAFRGGGMPSSHCAEATIVMLFAIRYYRKKAWFLIPIVIGLFAGTVYGRFHYLSDVFAGVLIGLFVYWTVIYFYPIKAKEKVIIKSEKPHFYSRLSQRQ